MSYGRLVLPSKVRIHTHTLRYRNPSEDLTRSSVTDDAWMLYAARVEARSKFDSNRSLPIESIDTQHKINEAEEVARILRQNVVQGQMVEGTGVGDKRFRLRIHDETEKGDNETIKKGTGAAAAGKACCGGASELAQR